MVQLVVILSAILCNFVGAAVCKSTLDRATEPFVNKDLWMEVTLKSGEKISGEWIASHVHDYWNEMPPVKVILRPREVTQVLFQKAKMERDPSQDRSLRFIHSKQIRNCRIDPPSKTTVSYRESLRKRRLCFVGHFLNDPSKKWVSWVDRENHDPRDHLVENGEGLFAWDLVWTLPNSKLFFKGLGTRNEDHAIWGQTIRFPMQGHFGKYKKSALITEQVESFEDLAPNLEVSRSNEGKENYLVARVFGNFEVVLAHLKKGSISKQFQSKKEIALGTETAEVGNSGWTQYPHLHLSLFWNDRIHTKRQWSVPSEFCKLDDKSFTVPKAGEWID